MTTAGLNVRFSPEEISIHIDDSQILHLNFHSNPVPANVTFITEELDCGDDCKTSQHTVLASDIEEKVSLSFQYIAMTRSTLSFFSLLTGAETDGVVRW